MIKSKLLFSLIFLIFTFSLVLVSALRLSHPDLISISSSHDLNENIGQIEATLSSQKIVNLIEYNFPNPGILPNHPFYWLKMIRDKIQISLTRDNYKLLNLYLLNADKRLIAGKILILNNQKDLGISTITKAEKYLTKAAFLLVHQFDRQKDYLLYENTIKTYLKHQVEISEILLLINDQKKGALEEIVDSNKKLFQSNFNDILSKFEPASPSAKLSN